MTFSIFAQESNKGKDNRYPLSIRLYHNGSKKYLPTIYRAPKSAFGRNMTLRDPYLLKICTDLIQTYENQIKKLGTPVASWSAQDIKNYLCQKKDGALSFVTFTQQYLTHLHRPGTARNIQTTLNSVLRFSNKKDLLFTDITPKFLYEYETWLLQEKKIKGRGVSLYTGYIRLLFNEAQKTHNDDEKGITPIPSPFKKYKIPKAPITRKRALSKNDLLAIKNYQPQHHRDKLAQDLFLLSFLLVGMNSADLYTCPAINNGRITYHRAKTKTRRADQAEISIKIEPPALHIINQYAGKHPLLLNLQDHYSTTGTLNAAINKGLKTIGKTLGLETLTFYAARHSWATIAVNDCNIPKSDVHEALNHIDPAMRITDIYIRKNWSRIDRANRKVLDHVFGQ